MTFRRRIASCEVARIGAPQSAISQTFNFNAGTDPVELARQLRDGMEEETVSGLRETIRRFPQQPLGDGHSYAKLPNSTNVVTMAEGSIRLALPLHLKADLRTKGAGSATLKRPPATTGDDE